VDELTEQLEAFNAAMEQLVKRLAAEGVADPVNAAADRLIEALDRIEQPDDKSQS
jgi:hypothetical protein